MALNALVVVGILALGSAGVWLFNRVFAGLCGGIFGRSLASRYGIDRGLDDLARIKWRHAGWTKVGHSVTSRVFIAGHENGLLLRARSAFGHPMSCTLLVPWTQVRMEATTDDLGFKQRCVVIDSDGSPPGRIQLGSVPSEIRRKLNGPA